MLRFGFLFSYTTEPSLPEPQTPWDIEAAEIAPVEQDDSSQPSDPQSEVLSGGGSIKFLDLAPKSTSRAATPIPSVQILDLCKALYKSKQSHQDFCAGYMLNESEGERKYGLFLQRLPKTQQMSYSFVSLQDILASKNKFTRFGYPAKMKIAAAIANSMMKLYDTPWLGSYWKKEDIFFLQCGGRIKFESPYIRKGRLDGKSHNDEVSTWSLHQPRNEALYNLGILLTEICFGMSWDEIIEEVRKTEDQVCFETHNRRRNLLAQVVADVAEEVGKEYSIAVQRCLFCDFNRLDIGFDCKDFYKVFYSEVVSHLQISDVFLDTDEF